MKCSSEYQKLVCFLAAVIFTAVSGSPAYSADNKAAGETNAEIVIIAAGDIMLSGSSIPVLEKKGYDYAFSDLSLAKLIKDADISFANLEYPITKKGKPNKDKKFVFKGSVKSFKAIKNAGFDMLSLANNHIMDYGEKGLVSTLQACRKYGMTCTGADENLSQACSAGVIKRRDVRVALLSYSMTFPKEYWATDETPGTAYGDKLTVVEDIALARQIADIVMASFHWGAELMTEPKPYQIEMAHLAIESGADMVFGHHPHVPQGIEIYKGKPVFYSLGNYAFGSYSKNSPISFIARITAGKKGVTGIRVYPVIVDNFKTGFKPEAAKNEEARLIIDYLAEISAPFGTRIIYENGTGEVVQ
jgi:poly-gamma-glutamate synthesis protein (capsule biosynthesis protein)